MKVTHIYFIFLELMLLWTSVSFLSSRVKGIGMDSASQTVLHGIRNPMRNVDLKRNLFVRILTKNPISLLITNTYSFFWNFPRANLPNDRPWAFPRNSFLDYLRWIQFPHNLPPYRYVGTGYPEDFFCYGLIGSTLPLGNWDPFDLAQVSKKVVRKYRESEIKHGRIAMLATLGYLMQEIYHPLYPDISGMSITHMEQLRNLPAELNKLRFLPFSLPWSADYSLLLVLFMSFETFTLLRNWTRWKRNEYRHQFSHNMGIGNLKDSYENGDYGFDPLKLMPDNEEDRRWIKEVELNHCRLAMLAFVGMIGQEYLTGMPVVSAILKPLTTNPEVDSASVFPGINEIFRSISDLYDQSVTVTKSL